jgi:hypothetical protein
MCNKENRNIRDANNSRNAYKSMNANISKSSAPEKVANMAKNSFTFKRRKIAIEISKV